MSPVAIMTGRRRWRRALAAGKRAACADLLATDPLYILYTSGTTGVPKGVMRDIGGYLVALKWSMANVYGLKPGETFWTASDIGWVVGHSYIVYGPLIHGCTTVLYEGKPVGTPDAGAPSGGSSTNTRFPPSSPRRRRFAPCARRIRKPIF